MRHAWTAALVCLIVGCTCRQRAQRRAAGPAGPSAMAGIDIPAVQEKVRTRADRPLLVVLWRAAMGGGDARAVLRKANALARRHGRDALEVLVINLDTAPQDRAQAIRAAGALDAECRPRSFGGDVMGLGAVLDPAWGGQLPAFFLYSADRSNRATGRPALSSYGEGASVDAVARRLTALGGTGR